MQLLHGAGALLQAHVRPRAAHQRTPLHISILQFARKPKIVFEVLKRGTQIVAGQVRAPEVPTRLADILKSQCPWYIYDTKSL